MNAITNAGTLPHKHKIVICGNHELSFDPKFVDLFKKHEQPSSRHADLALDNSLQRYGDDSDDIKDAVSTVDVRKYLTNCTYLEDSGAEIYGIKIYGSPW